MLNKKQIYFWKDYNGSEIYYKLINLNPNR